MVLKQFKLIDHKNYQLQVKETLTLKPEGFTMQVRPRVRQSRFVFHTAEKAGNDAKLTEKVILPTVETHGTFLLVLYLT